MSRIDDIKKRLKEINDTLQPLFQEQDKLENDLFDAKCVAMFETGALTEAEWTTNVNFDIGDRLTIISNTRRHKKLAYLFESDYHCTREFKDWQLHFADGDISINFEDAEKGLNFVKKYQLRIDLTDLEEAEEALNRKQNQLEKFIQTIKGSQK